MNLALHLAAWDLRYLRHYLGLWLGLLVLQAVLVGYAPHLFPVERGLVFSLSSFAGWLAVLKICLLAVIVAQLVQKDCTVGSTAFWLSRPVSRVRLLIGKFLFLVLAVILPSLLVEVGLLINCGVTPYDTLRSVPQIFFLALLAVVLLMMLAAVTTSLARAILAGGLAFLGLPLLWFLALGAWSLFFLGMETFLSDEITVARPVPPPSYDTVFVGTALVLFVISGGVVGCQYLTRRTTWSRIFLATGVLLALLTSSMGNWEQLLGTTPPGLDKAILNPAQVGARIERESLALASTRAPLSLFGWKRDKTMVLKGSIALSPLPSDVAAIAAQISAKLVLPSGEHLASHVSQSNYAFDVSPWDGGFVRGERAAALRQTIRGITLLDFDGPVGLHNWELFALGKDLYDRHREVGMAYTAQVDFLIQRNAIAAMRLEEGASYDRGSDRAAILSVDTTNRGHSIVHINEIGHRLMQDGRRQVTYLLINRSRRQALVGRDSGAFLSMPPHLSRGFPMLRVRRLRLNFSPPPNGPPIGPDWYDGAELIRVESRDLGWISRSIRLEDLVMERLARSSPEATPTEAGGGTNGSIERE